MHLPLSARIVVFPVGYVGAIPYGGKDAFVYRHPGRTPAIPQHRHRRRQGQSRAARGQMGRYLLDKGYTIFPVHPVRKTVWGLTAYPDLASLPQPVDIIDLFRAPQYCPAHAQEVLALP